MKCTAECQQELRDSEVYCRVASRSCRAIRCTAECQQELLGNEMYCRVPIGIVRL